MVRLFACICTLALGVCAVAAGAVRPPDDEVVDLSVRPAWVSLAALPANGGFAIAYDDRLSANALRLAVRTSGGWSTSLVADVIDGQRVGREPSLAVSSSGLRLIAFRTDLFLQPGTQPSGVLYAARSFNGKPWSIDRIDVNGFGAATAFDGTGRPAIAYLARVDASNAVDVRLARLQGGAWHIETLERTTYLSAPSGANSSAVGLAFDRHGRPWVAFVDPGSHSLRMVTSGAPSRRVATVAPDIAAAVLGFTHAGAATLVASGLTGASSGIDVVTQRAAGGRYRMRRIVSNGGTAPRIVAQLPNGPVVAFRNARGVQLATPTARSYVVDQLLHQSLGSGSLYAGSLGATDTAGEIGLALVAPRGLLVFAQAAIPAALSRASAQKPPALPRTTTTRPVITRAKPPTSRDWSTWGDGSARQGLATSSKLWAGGAAALKHAWARPIGGLGTAQPLFASGVRAGGAVRDLFLTGSESGVVTAYDATTGQTVWRATLAVTHPRCTQIPGGTYGVTGSPVYDAARHAVFAASSDRLWGIDVATGRPLPGWPVKLPIDPRHEHVWGALARRGTSIYAVTASYCDARPYKGKLIRVDETSKQVTEWDPVPTPQPHDGGGGIWGWGGAAIDPANGRVWVATGNALGAGIATDAAYDGEAVVKLTAGLRRLGASKAPHVPTHGDYDFGGTPVLFQPQGCPQLVAALNKNGRLYLWHAKRLSHGPYQQIRLAFPGTLLGSPAWDPRTGQLFVTTSTAYKGVPDGLHALRSIKGCRFQLGWTRRLGGLLDSTPTVANNIVAVGTGSGYLRIFSTQGGAPLYSYRIGKPVFAAPIMVDRAVAVVSWRKRIDVFKLP